MIFNPLNSRNKLIGSLLNSYLSNSIEGYTPATNTATAVKDKHPLLNENQEIMLEDMGVDVSQLPTKITPGIQTCFIEKLGSERAQELVDGATPGVMDILKARECIGE